MELKKCPEDGTCCFLDILYPNSDASLACDDECHRVSNNFSHDLFYEKEYPNKIINFNKNIE